MKEFLSQQFTVGVFLTNVFWALILAGLSRLIMWCFGKKPKRQWALFLVTVVTVFCLLLILQIAVGQSQRPQLNVRLQEINIGQIENGIYPMVVLVVKISNSGSPTIAEDWQFTAQPAGSSQQIKAISLRIPNTVTLIGAPGRDTITYYAKDALYDKVGSAPIPRGGEQTGLLAFGFTSASSDDLRRLGTKFTLQVHDVFGNVYSDNFTWSHDDMMIHPFHPGLQAPATRPMQPLPTPDTEASPH